MSKRDLKKYLGELDNRQLAEQVVSLYEKFPEVKVYFDFVFNPREEKLVADAKAKILNEYFPKKSKRAKLRRSTAQKIIKHFLNLGVDASSIADVMLYSIETAIRYSARRDIRYESFYKSILTSYEQAIRFVISNQIQSDYRGRLDAIKAEVQRQGWGNSLEFGRLGDMFEEDGIWR